MSGTFLDAIVERNKAFVARRAAQPLAALEPLHLAVVACYDPRLDALFQPALGYEPGKTFLFRTAGALVQPTGATLRSLSMAVYMFGVTEVLVVGHTSCRMAQFQANQFVETFRRRGVTREAFGEKDLREWAGAIPSPRRGVEISVANIVAAPFLPKDLAVAGAVLDDETGALEIVVRPGETVAPPQTREQEFAQPVPQTPAPEAATAAAAAAAAKTAAAAAASTAPPTASAAPAPGEDGAAAALTHDVTEFARLLGSKQRWRDDLKTLQGELDRPHHPLVKYRMLESIARRAGAESREVLDAFERVKRSVIAARQSLETEDLYRLFLQVVGKQK